MMRNLLRLAQVATGRVVPLTGPLSLLDFDVQSEVEPFQTTAWTVHIKVSRVAIGSLCDMIGDIRDLRAESGVGNILGLPHKLWH
jgi:hypothetical protein